MNISILVGQGDVQVFLGEGIPLFLGSNTKIKTGIIWGGYYTKPIAAGRLRSAIPPASVRPPIGKESPHGQVPSSIAVASARRTSERSWRSGSGRANSQNPPELSALSVGGAFE